MQILIIFLALLLIGCADDGAFNFSTVETTTTTINNFEPEPNEGQSSENDSMDGSGSNPVCTEAQRLVKDGLFKPISDSDGNAVFLAPSIFTEKFLKVTLNGEVGRFTGFANGGRQHWRFIMPGSEYEAPATIVAESLNGECVFIVPNPSERTE
jgi:hypothetical protein